MIIEAILKDEIILVKMLEVDGKDSLIYNNEYYTLEGCIEKTKQHIKYCYEYNKIYIENNTYIEVYEKQII